MAVAYGIIFALSLLLPFGYCFFVRKSQKEPWLFALYISVCVVNLGYLLLSLSKTVEFAIFANKVVYFGQVFVPLCMFLIISKLCGFTYKNRVKYALVGAAMVMFALVLTTGHLDWYYKSVKLIQVDGAAKLVKEYGILHPANLIYVLSYFVAMITVIIISIKKSNGKTQKQVGLTLAVVIGNVGMWVVEKLVSWNFEFLSVSYLMSAFVFFFVYWMLQDYVHKEDIPTLTPVETRQLGVDVATMPMEEKIGRVLAFLPSGEVLPTREREVLEAVLENKKRKDIAFEMHLSENTIKTYTRNLYSKLGVCSREELYKLLLQK